MARTQKNKATAYHLGLLKAKLAKYKRELLMPTAKGAAGATGEGNYCPAFDLEEFRNILLNHFYKTLLNKRLQISVEISNH